jgi:hypothetical protein
MRRSCKRWLKTEYPKIKKMAQMQGADIYFGDAAHTRSEHHAGRTWGKKGETPVVETTGARHGIRSEDGSILSSRSETSSSGTRARDADIGEVALNAVVCR